MRFFLLVLLFGLAAALPRDEYYQDEGEDEDVKTEIGKKLKEELQEILAKIKDALDHGRDVKDDLIEKVKKIKETLKELHIEIKGKLKEMFEKAKNRLRDWFRKLWEKDDDVNRRDLRDKLRDILCKLKDKLRETLDKGKIRQFIEEKVPEGKLREVLLRYLEKGRSHLKRIIDFVEGKHCGGDDDDDDDEVSRRDLKFKIKDFVHKLKEKLQKVADDQKIKEFIEDHVPEGKFREILLSILKKGRDHLQRFIDMMGRDD